MEELKPCPFCGSGEIKIEKGKGKIIMWLYQVSCQECYCGTSWEDSKKFAINQWNRRV